jgi:hypothetical protein
MNRCKRRLNLVASFAALGACASVTSNDGLRMAVRSDSFAEYVESVFRFQNETASQLAFLLGANDLTLARYAELEAAETALLEACDGLNEIAVSRRNGEPERGLGALRAARTAPQCEQAAFAAAAAVGDAR